MATVNVIFFCCCCFFVFVFSKCNLGKVKHETMLVSGLHCLSYVGWSWA